MLGREFVKATGDGFSDAELEQMNLPEGAEWFRDARGTLCVRINGWGETSAKQAMIMGVLKFQWTDLDNNPRVIQKYHPRIGAAYWSLDTRHFILDENGQPIPAA